MAGLLAALAPAVLSQALFSEGRAIPLGGEGEWIIRQAQEDGSWSTTLQVWSPAQPPYYRKRWSRPETSPHRGMLRIAKDQLLVGGERWRINTVSGPQEMESVVHDKGPIIAAWAHLPGEAEGQLAYTASGEAYRLPEGKRLERKPDADFSRKLDASVGGVVGVRAFGERLVMWTAAASDDPRSARPLDGVLSVRGPVSWNDVVRGYAIADVHVLASSGEGRNEQLLALGRDARSPVLVHGNATRFTVLRLPGALSSDGAADPLAGLALAAQDPRRLSVAADGTLFSVALDRDPRRLPTVRAMGTLSCGIHGLEQRGGELVTLQILGDEVLGQSFYRDGLARALNPLRSSVTVWSDRRVPAGASSEPLALGGVGRATLHVRSSGGGGDLSLEVDASGDGRFQVMERFELVPASAMEPQSFSYVFPPGFDASWVRVRAEAPATLEVTFSLADF